MSDLPTPPSGNPISARTRVSLTIPQLFALLAVVVLGVLGWSRIDVRLGRIEERLGIVEDNQNGKPTKHSLPVIGAISPTITNDKER